MPTRQRQTRRSKTADKGLLFNIQKFSLNDGPGIRTVVFFKGCPLKCAWCANPESQLRHPEEMYDEAKGCKIMVGEYKTVPEIMDVIMQDFDFYEESGGGVTFSGGEVLFQAPFAIKLAQAIKEKGIHLACETTGYATPAVFAEFYPYMDLIYFDCKQWSPLLHRQGTGGTNEMILKNMQTVIDSGKDYCIRIPVIPGFNYTDNDAKHFGELFQKMGVKEVELLPFHQFGLKKYADLGREYELKDVAQLHTNDLLEYQKILQNAGIDAQINGW
ncbi:glycyl-radical enzyme activating protein [Ligilactobacillus acidipiscis]|uniref:Formate acetyltransferase activating enzyme n=1 Tax=Ligilactobacillus acidipiscis TaxID=89059 RepID=A0A0R2KJB5_9LACO|nr:glycyl-radical enzyme activating protein [Ligilactobacillus acidipiscis]KRN86605.1 formate acetyltransferase activating enzyme [Ligilactobacillus acidipiscis]SFV41580.1 Pyruvate formate-lyase activating enzyme [Ligilactobacillus acidipiscis]